MFHLCAYYESTTNGVTYAEVNGVFDQVIPGDASNRFQFQGDWELMASYASGINLTAARINAPSFRMLGLPEIYPGNDTADVPTIDQIVQYYGHGPRFVKNEPVIVEVSRGGADAQPVVCGLWVRPKPNPAPAGPVFTFPFTTSNTIVAGSWSTSALTAVQTLPAGVYAVVGCRVLANDAFFARLVFPASDRAPQQHVMRPGCLVNDAYGDLTLGDPFTMGRMGLWGYFENIAIPSLELIGDSAGAESCVVYLDLIKV